MKNFLVYLILSALVNLSYCQNHDINWMFGGTNFIPGEKDGILLNFDESKRKILQQEIEIAIDQQNGTISDADGKLLFYSNGCKVIGADHEMIEGGDSLNYGEWYSYINDCQYGYTGPQNMIILPDPGNANGYYILHKKFQPTPEDVSLAGIREYLYSYVAMSLNEGKGKVIYKNKLLFKRFGKLMGSFNAAVKHENNKDWWIIAIGNYSNTYFKFLLNKDGISVYDSTSIGEKLLDPNISSGGQSKFSPDGRKYALFSVISGLLLFDFDRSTGALAFVKKFKILHTLSFTGLEFSANGRFLYISVIDTLYQLDLSEPNLDDGLRVVGVWDKSSNPFETTFCLMQRGPDCRIYISSPSSTNTIHVINNPDGLGDACDFRQHGLDLNDRSTGTLSMPNFPNYRLDTGPVCDPSIATSTSPLFQAVQPVMVWPNPAHDVIHLDLPQDKSKGIYQIYDITGRLVVSAFVSDIDTGIDVSNLGRGIYVVRYIDNDGGAFSGKVLLE